MNFEQFITESLSPNKIYEDFIKTFSFSATPKKINTPEELFNYLQSYNDSTIQLINRQNTALTRILFKKIIEKTEVTKEIIFDMFIYVAVKIINRFWKSNLRDSMTDGEIQNLCNVYTALYGGVSVDELQNYLLNKFTKTGCSREEAYLVWFKKDPELEHYQFFPEEFEKFYKDLLVNQKSTQNTKDIFGKLL